MLTCGVDEAGRGPLAGPVVAAAVILADTVDLPALADSKALSAPKRQQLAQLICQQALAVSIGVATVKEIDQINILQAALLAMQRAIMRLSHTGPFRILVDGLQVPSLPISCVQDIQSVVKGDRLVREISAASIIAKVARDDYCIRLLARQYPQYGFDQHKAYPTKAHLAALARYGVTEAHRRTFSPVRKCLHAH